MISGTAIKFWRDAPKDEAHTHVFAHVKAVDHEQADLHKSNVCFAKLYSNRDEPGLGGNSRQAVRAWDVVTENVISSVVDTATALIAKSRPKLKVVTEGADYDLQQTAKQLEKYLWGQFQALAFHQRMAQIFRDACVFGTGVLKLFTRAGQICAERVLIDEIVVDESECRSGSMPRQLHQVRFVARDQLAALYPKHADAIRDAGEAWREEGSAALVDPDMVLVIESWYLSPGGSTPGRHTICVDNATLVDEGYKRDWFPFVFLRWSPPLTGWYGQGLAEALLGLQIRINELNDFINRCQDLIAVPRVAVDIGSKLLKVQLNNEIGCIIPYVGKPPVFFTPQALSAEIYSYKEQLKAAAFELAGISKMAAQATRPEGIEAAVALRELSDNQSQRFSIQQAHYEDAHVEAGRMMLALAREIHGSTGTAPRVFMADRFVEAIDFPDIDDENNKYVLQVMPASMMSMTPAGRLQTVIELAQYGVPLSPAQIVRLLGLSDLEEEQMVMTSKLDNADWVASELMKGNMMRPEPAFQDIPLVIERVTAHYRNAQRQGAPERVLSRLRNYITLAATKLPKPQPTVGDAMNGMVPPPGPMDPMAMGAAPMGAGQPTPLLPPSAALDAGALPGLMIPPGL